MADLWKDFWTCETGTGQQVPQLHDRYMMMMMILCAFYWRHLISMSALYKCVHDSGKWVHVVYFAFLPSQLISNVEDKVRLPLCEGSHISISNVGCLCCLINKCYWPTVRCSYPTSSRPWYATKQPVMAVGCYIYSFFDAISISADLFRTASRNVSLHPSCTSPKTHCPFTQCLL